MKHVLSPLDLDDADRAFILERAAQLKRDDPAPRPSRLRVGALYCNPSLRTRASFEQAAALLGGRCQTLNAGADTWALELDPEAVMDGAAVENVVEAARVLGQLFHLLGVRSFRGSEPWAVERHEPVLRAFAEHAGVPVISLEGATQHPCQGLADRLTLSETFGDDLAGLPVAVVWCWHPRALPPAVPQTALLEFALAGCDVALVHPPGYELDADVLRASRQQAQARGGGLSVHHDRSEGLRGRRLVYAKSWGPLDPPSPSTPADLRGWRLDRAALRATDDARVMHCLPVRRNVVVAGEVLDSPLSLVTRQAGNRLWAQAGLIDRLAREAGVLEG